MAMAEPEEWDRQRNLPRRIGDVSEAAFLLKARSLGFGVALPWGESERFDFIVWGQLGTLSRVQVKATTQKHRRGFCVHATCNRSDLGKLEYTAEDIDFLAAHIQPINVWYVLPVEVFAPAQGLTFYPDIESRRARWEHYREAWHLLERRDGPRRLSRR
jgi:hypothetical protein